MARKILAFWWLMALAQTASPAPPAPTAPAPTAPPSAVHWQHPAGLVTEQTFAEIGAKLKDQAWARRVYEARRAALEKWVHAPSEDLRGVFPRQRGNVYHNFSCPTDRCRLTFDPFACASFVCPSCGKRYAPDLNPGVYPPGDRYYGTLYDGWACLFYEEAGAVAADLGIFAAVEPGGAQGYAKRGVEILMLYADTIEGLQTRKDPDPQMNVLLTYHREGDSTVLFDLARAYEVLRAQMSAEQRTRFERVVLQRILDEVMLEPIYRYEHNNLYQWHRSIVQTALALERSDLIDWSFGFGDFAPERKPEHRSLRRILATHFKPDGAYWEMCSGYHLYPLFALCEFAAVSRNLAQMDPEHFPPAQYDLTCAQNPQGQVIQRALHWFMSMAMPDRTMPTVGDSMAPRAGMDDYYATAEVGYRFFGLKAVGDYERFRQGNRSWSALLYGAAEIRSEPTPFSSSYLSSGWVSLRNEWKGNRVWLGLNALIPGGGHQHADRLGLLSYSEGQLLALEKATPYNENVTRELGRLSPMHNTVTVDRSSQKPGGALRGQEIPKVAYFFTSPMAQVAQLDADHVYAQTKVYRRTVVLLEDIYVDQFRVEGGKVLDWMLHHTGSAPQLNVTLKEERFEPASWLAQGLPQARAGRSDGAWEARWNVKDVTSRLTMLGAPGTEIYALQTYPVDQAVITKEHPPCQSLCVRRHGDSSFLAIGDAWRDAPNLQTITPGNTTNSLCLKTKANTYYLLFGPGQARFEDGVSVESDAAVVVLRNRDALLLVGGTAAKVNSSQGSLQVALQSPGCLAAELTAGSVTYEAGESIQYETLAGENSSLLKTNRTVQFSGDLWKIATKQQRVTGKEKAATPN